MRLKARKAKYKYKNDDAWVRAVYRKNKEYIDSKLYGVAEKNKFKVFKNLINERSTYEKELNNGAEYVTAPKSGVLSYRIDGLENVLTTDDFSKINKKFLNNLNLKTSQIIGTSDEKGKIIDNFKSTNKFLIT